MNKTTAMLILATFLLSAGLPQAAAPASYLQGDDQKINGEKVYSIKEVSQRAVITSKPNPKFVPGCGDQGNAEVRVLLHKSGKVTDVQIIRSAGCGFDEEVMKAAQQIKFKPARKDGVEVSQYQPLVYAYKKYR